MLKTNKHFLEWICAVSLLFFLLICLFLFRIEIFKSPWDLNLKFHYPYSAVKDKLGNIILIDSNEKGYNRLVKMKPDGTIQWYLDGGKRTVNGFYSTYQVEVSSKEIFILNVVPNREDGTSEIYEIKKYSENGKYLDTVAAYDYNAETRNGTNNYGIRSFSVLSNRINYILEAAGELDLYTVDINSHQKKKIKTLPFPSDVLDIAVKTENNFYAAYSDGRIFSAEGKSIKPVLPNSAFNNLNPWPLRLSPDGELYFTDLFSQNILKIHNHSVQKVFSLLDEAKNGSYPYKNPLISLFSISSDGSVTTIDRNSGVIVQIKTSGKIDYFRSGHFGYGHTFLRLFLWLALILTFALIIFTSRIFYRDVMQYKIPLMMKQIFLFIPIMLVSIVFICITLFNEFENLSYKQQGNEYANLAQIGRETVHGDYLNSLNRLSDIHTAAYKSLIEDMNLVKKSGNHAWNEQIERYVYKVKNGVFYVCDSYGNDFLYPYTVQPAHHLAYDEGVITNIHYQDENGEWIAGVAPIYDSKEKIAGVYEVSSSLSTYNEIKKQFIWNLIRNIVLSVLVLFLAFGLFTYVLLFALRKLKLMLVEISHKNFDISVNINTRDEIQDLAGGFNTMAKEIREHISYINRLNIANSHFVPVEFLHHLGRDNITEVKLGDQIQKNMAILFSDIRSFTTLSESMSPKENFNFLNSYLKRISPVIRKHRGYIDKYIGDAIMALFPINPEDAVKASVEMREKLKEYNFHRSKSHYQPISTGIGVHYGSLILGIIGEEERFEGTVIADAVNLASRLEGLTKHFGTDVIVSGAVFNSIKDSEIKYQARMIGFVTVKGKKEPIEIWEILSDLTPFNLMKIELKEFFKEALKIFCAGDLKKAQKAFQAILKKNPDDKPAQIYARQCETLLKQGLPEGWDGSLIFDEK